MGRRPQPRGRRQARALQWALLAAVLAVYTAHAFHLRWIAEDAYISFRYARNLIEGQGLVFNPGERVEGYTDFLWVLILAGGMKVGLRPEPLAIGMGIASSVATFFCLLRLHRRLSGSALLFPFALLALAVNYTWACFGTSGLETSLVCALVSAAFVAIVEGTDAGGGSRREIGLVLAASASIALAMMTRPDAVLCVPAVALFLLAQRPGGRALARRAALLALPLAAIYLPYFLWRTGYYGDLLPNTYYAKSADLAYYRQGLVYLWEFVDHYFLWLFLPVPLVALWISRRRGSSPDPLVTMLGAYVLLHAFYVVRVGGDFMEGRFFVAILPFLYLILEHSVRAVFRDETLRVVVLLALVAAAGVRREIIPPGVTRKGITDERGWREGVRLWYLEGEAFGRSLPPGTWVATDAVGAFGFGSRLPIVDVLGLTDRTVARQPLTQRGLAGHEKQASLEYLTGRGSAVLRVGMRSFRVPRPPDFEFAGNRYYLLSDDPAVVRGFRRAAAELTRGGP